jgi:hypothetical protein
VSEDKNTSGTLNTKVLHSNIHPVRVVILRNTSVDLRMIYLMISDEDLNHVNLRQKEIMISDKYFQDVEILF